MRSLYTQMAFFTSIFCFLAVGVANAEAIKFKGSFETFETSSADCDEVFTGTNVYPITHYLTGPTGLNSVLHFDGTTPATFFSNLTLTGYFGYQNDFDVARTFNRNGFQYSLHAQGNVTYQFFLMNMKVEKRVIGSKDVLCTATGDFSAFH